MAFLEPVLFELPVLPRIKKYINTKLQDEAGQPQPFLVSAESQGASLMLWALAQAPKVLMQFGQQARSGPHAGPRAGGGRSLFADDLTARLGLGIAEFHPSRHQYLLNMAELNVFSQFVDYLIRNELVCQCQARPDWDPIRHIRAFVDRYDFSDDDINEQTLRQTYLRHRQGRAGSTYSVQVNDQPHFRAMAA